MRKIAASLFISLDGVTESPDQWQFAFDDEMGAAMTAPLEEQDTVLLGRVTYTEWSQYWPTSTEEPFATLINRQRRYVASTTLTEVDEWPNSTLIQGPVADFVTKLREEDGGPIGVGGSPTLVRHLIDKDLLDELTLLIHPVVAGGNRQRLFTPDTALKKLELVDARPTSTGVIIATYHPVRRIP